MSDFYDKNILTLKGKSRNTQDNNKTTGKGSGGFYRYGKGECPICGGVRKDCSISLTTNLIHCWENSISSVSGYIFRGISKIGCPVWCSVEDSQAWKDQTKEERVFQKKEENKRKKERREEFAKTLSPIERDHIIRKILDQLTLSEADRQKLRERGLTDQEINTANYRSLTFKYQKLNLPVDFCLSGVNKSRRGLTNHAPGILIPVPNCDGLYEALQVNYGENSEGLGKYQPLGKDWHQQNGEQPIACYGVKHNKGTVLVTESVAYKPYIASLRLRLPAIGIVGSNFGSYPQSFKQAFTKLETKTVIMPFDSGTCVNWQILSQVDKFAEQCEFWGVELLFAYWGQEKDKSIGDIDEISLETIEKIKFLTVQEFYQLVPTEVREKAGIKLKRANTFPLRNNPLYRGDRIEFKDSSQRKTTIIEAAKEADIVIDTSFCGSGKTHFLKGLKPEDFETIGKFRQVLVITPKAKNPTVEGIKNDRGDNVFWPRHDGLFFNPDTGLYEKNKEGNTKSNCHLTEKFDKAAKVGIDSETAKEIFCKGCKFKSKCGLIRGDGFGFKHQRSQAEKSPLALADINSVSAEGIKDKVVIIDELSSIQLDLTKESQLKDFLGSSRLLNQELGNKLSDFLDAFESIALTAKDKKYGYFIRPEKLPQISSGVIEILEAIVYKQQSNALEKDSIPDSNDWLLLDLLKVASGLVPGAIRIENQTVYISVPNHRQRRILSEAGKLIILDATPNWVLLNNLFTDKKITEVKESASPLSNLTILDTYLRGVSYRANLKEDRGELERADAFIKLRKSQHPNLEVIGYKGLGNKYYWNHSNRATNKLKGVNYLLVIGSPNPNLNAIRAEALTNFGSDENLESYYETKKVLEIIQCIGRQRVQHYPDRQFTIEFVSDGDLNLESLAYLYGAKYQQTTALEASEGKITSPGQETKLRTLEAIVQLLEAGEKVTQKAIASLLGVSQQLVSKQLDQTPCPVSDTGDILKKTTNCYKDLIAISCFFDKKPENPCPIWLLVQSTPEIRSWLDLPLKNTGFSTKQLTPYYRVIELGIDSDIDRRLNELRATYTGLEEWHARIDLELPLEGELDTAGKIKLTNHLEGIWHCFLEHERELASYQEWADSNPKEYQVELQRSYEYYLEDLRSSEPEDYDLILTNRTNSVKIEENIEDKKDKFMTLSTDEKVTETKDKEELDQDLLDLTVSQLNRVSNAPGFLTVYNWLKEPDKSHYIDRAIQLLSPNRINRINEILLELKVK